MPGSCYAHGDFADHSEGQPCPSCGDALAAYESFTADGRRRPKLTGLKTVEAKEATSANVTAEVLRAARVAATKQGISMSLFIERALRAQLRALGQRETR